MTCIAYYVALFGQWIPGGDRAYWIGDIIAKIVRHCV